MQNELYTVTRQSQWPTGANVVEVSLGGLDYTNPDALASRYDGEFEEFEDPREAVRIAMEIADKWKAHNPEKKIGVAVGDTGGYTCPFEPTGRRKLIEWAESEYESLSKCDRCGKIVKGSGCHLSEYDGTFCSEQCAENTYCDLIHELEE